MGRPCKPNGEKMEAYWVFVGKPEGKTPLGRHRRRWEGNIEMALTEIVWVMLIGFIWQRALVNTIMKLPMLRNFLIAKRLADSQV
jgi:hypothetical protein